MRAFRVCEHNNCNDRAKVMNGNIIDLEEYKKAMGLEWFTV